jgi:L-aminopeptidase/D-esterase-like protein
MKGGIGTASFTVDGVTVGAIIACNALGDVFNPFNGELLAGARTARRPAIAGTRDALLAGEARPILAGSNTTIGVVATDAIITKARLTAWPW